MAGVIFSGGLLDFLVLTRHCRFGTGGLLIDVLIEAMVSEAEGLLTSVGREMSVVQADGE